MNENLSSDAKNVAEAIPVRSNERQRILHVQFFQQPHDT